MSASPRDVRIREIFAAFLLIGGTSFGGGVVAHLRNSLVAKHQWVDDKTFMELLGISQSLPGLSSTNMAVLVGDRLRGTPGALSAIVSVCLPGAVLMYLVGVVYEIERKRPLVEAGLDGVAAAAVGLIAATILTLGRKSFSRFDDLVFIATTIVLVNRLHVTVPYVLLTVAVPAAVWYGFVVRTTTGPSVR